ncbi:MAG: radical SAM protein [Sediminibacterium sp.]
MSLSPNFKKSIDTLAKIGRVNKRYELFLNLTYKCPLRCTYCYVDYNRAPPMTEEQVDYIIEKLFIRPSKPSDIKLITFFGGEPALEMDIIEKTVSKWYEHPRMKNVHFGIITSFSVNQERLLKLQTKYPKLEIAISFDVDMSDRVYINKKPFNLLEVCQEKYNIDLLEMSQNNNNIFFNKVITGNENDLYSDLIHLHEIYEKYGIFYSLTFTKTPKFAFHPEGEITKHWYRYLKFVLDKYLSEETVFLPMLVLQYLDRYWKRENNTAVSGCGLASEYFIDSNGTISPCSISHHRTDLMLFHEGKFLDNNERFQELEENYWNNPTCQACDIKGFCPGGCMVFRYMENKNYDIPNEGQCILMEEIFEAYKKLLSEYDEKQIDKLYYITAKDLQKYYEYCLDKTTHLDLHGIYNKKDK